MRYDTFRELTQTLNFYPRPDLMRATRRFQFFESTPNVIVYLDDDTFDPEADAVRFEKILSLPAVLDGLKTIFHRANPEGTSSEWIFEITDVKAEARRVGHERFGPTDLSGLTVSIGVTRQDSPISTGVVLALRVFITSVNKVLENHRLYYNNDDMGLWGYKIPPLEALKGFEEVFMNGANVVFEHSNKVIRPEQHIPGLTYCACPNCARMISIGDSFQTKAALVDFILSAGLTPSQLIRFRVNANVWTRYQLQDRYDSGLSYHGFRSKTMGFSDNQKSMFAADWFDLKLAQNPFKGRVHWQQAHYYVGPPEGRPRTSHILQQGKKVFGVDLARSSKIDPPETRKDYE